MKDNKMKDKINEVGVVGGGMAGSDFEDFDFNKLPWVKLAQKKEEQQRKAEYKNHPAKVLNKKLYWDICDALKLAQSVQATIEKDKISVPTDFADALDDLINAAYDYTNCVRKHIGIKR